MKILTAIKHSKFEWERIKFGWTEEELKAKLIKEKSNLDAILKSHDKQLMVRGLFKKFLPMSDFVMMDEIQDINKYDLVIVLGGDNSFTKVSHCVGNTPILGVNSDPGRSVGCLTRYSVNNEQDVLGLAKKLTRHEYKIEEWSRLNALLNDEPILPATSEYFLGERLRKDMSRHILIFNGQEVEQKCSGLIVSTGAGSTGWYQSVQNEISWWKPTEKYFGFTTTEPYKHSKLDWGIVDEGEELIIHSLNDNQGSVSIDSWEENSFNRGDKIKVFLGEPLKVLIPNE